FAEELIALRPNVLFGGEPSSARALKSVSSALPIVCPTLGDALIPELAASYARPGANVTGIALTVEDMTGKLLELGIEILHGLMRIGFLSNPAGASMHLYARKLDQDARAHRIAVVRRLSLCEAGAEFVGGFGHHQMGSWMLRAVMRKN